MVAVGSEISGWVLEMIQFQHATGLLWEMSNVMGEVDVELAARGCRPSEDPNARYQNRLASLVPVMRHLAASEKCEIGRTAASIMKPDTDVVDKRDKGELPP